MIRPLRAAFALLCAVSLPVLAHATTFTVTGQDSLWNADTLAQPGDVIQGSGAWPAVQLPPGAVHAAPGVTFQPIPGQTWSLTSIGVSGGGKTLKGLDIALSKATQYGVDVEGGQNIVLDGLKVHQADGTSMAEVGVFVRGSNGVTVQNSEFSFLGVAAAFSGDNQVKILGNKLHDINVDGFDFGSTNDITIAGNTGTDFYPNLLAGDHPDFIQFMAGGGQGQAKITGNTWRRGKGGAIQGIQTEDSHDILIDANELSGTMPNGIAIARSPNVTITRNLVRGTAPEGARIIARQRSDNLVATANFITQPIGDSDPQDDGIDQNNLNTTVQNNLTVAPYDPAAAPDPVYQAWVAAIGQSAPPPPPIPPPAVNPLQASVNALTDQVNALLKQLLQYKAKIKAAQAALAP